MLMIKKNRILILCVVIIGFIIIVIRYTPVPIIFLDLFETTKSMNDEQIVKIFNKNQNNFVDAKNIFGKCSYITWIEKATMEKRSAPDGRYDYKTSKGLFVESKQKLSSDNLKYIDSSGIYNILIKMKFKSITSCEEYICFTQASSLSDANGIMYIPNIKQFDEKDVEIKQIGQGWYIFHDK